MPAIEPHVVEYLKTPPSRALLVELIDRAGGIAPRELLREKGTTQCGVGLGDTSKSDDALVDAMMAHSDPHQPASWSSRHSREAVRPSEAVLDLLPSEQLGAFAQETVSKWWTLRPARRLMLLAVLIFVANRARHLATQGLGIGWSAPGRVRSWRC